MFARSYSQLKLQGAEKLICLSFSPALVREIFVPNCHVEGNIDDLGIILEVCLACT